MAVIDFDRATARRSAVGPFTRWLARRRVARSIAKLGLPGLTHAEAAALLVPILGRSSP
jgi:hypothetical protein